MRFQVNHNSGGSLVRCEQLAVADVARGGHVFVAERTATAGPAPEALAWQGCLGEREVATLRRLREQRPAIAISTLADIVCSTETEVLRVLHHLGPYNDRES